MNFFIFVALFVTSACAVVLPPLPLSPLSQPADSDDSASAPKTWVLIAAGSNGFYNYRHQADACHAYQIMHRHGIPDSQMIVMQYDDIAHDSENPTPGIVINHPNGSDVYKGCLKDYTGDTVSAVNFLKVLTGDAAGMKGIGSGKVIKSGPHDHIFVNFVDHGAPGIVAFVNDELASTDFMVAMKMMHKKKKYAKMVLYFEACESGSMFEGLLPKDIDVFATTASNADESSYACYYDDLRQTYLGDVYSVNWMEDSDKNNFKKESLQQQFLKVRQETNTSHVEEYGNTTIAKLTLSEFMGKKDTEPILLPYASKADAIPTESVYMTLLRKKAGKAQTSEEKKYWELQVQTALEKRKFLLDVVRKIAVTVAKNSAHMNQLLTTRRKFSGESIHQCLTAANKYFSKKCFSLAKNDYALFTAPRLFANACTDGIPVRYLLAAMDKTCNHQTMHGIH